jgi:aspartyl protease family protein
MNLADRAARAHGTARARRARCAAGGQLRRLAAAALVVASGTALAQSVSLNGVMGQQAMLVIDGKTHVVAPGRTVQGVRVISVSGSTAEVEVSGKRSRLEVGAQPVQLAGRSGSDGGSTIVLPAGSGGHFFVQAAVNGKTIPFIVDTGATSVALSRMHAEAIGLKLDPTKVGYGQTANGVVMMHVVTLDSVRVGDVVVHNVEAVVLAAPMSHALLGNSFLSRFSMVRENDVMRLTKR